MIPATSDRIMGHAGNQVVQQLSRIMPPAIELKLNLLGTQAHTQEHCLCSCCTLTLCMRSGHLHSP